MPIPNNITNNAAEIYEASLLYEQNGKCGETSVITTGESWTAGAGDVGWKIVALVGAGELDAFTSDSISLADSAKLTTAAGFVWGVGTEVRASIKSIQVASGTFIIYKDCPQS